MGLAGALGMRQARPCYWSQTPVQVAMRRLLEGTIFMGKETDFNGHISEAMQCQQVTTLVICTIFKKGDDCQFL